MNLGRALTVAALIVGACVLYQTEHTTAAGWLIFAAIMIAGS